MFRTSALRFGSFNSQFANYLGHNEGDIEEVEKPGLWPLLRFGMKMMNVENTFTSAMYN